MPSAAKGTEKKRLSYHPKETALTIDKSPTNKDAIAAIITGVLAHLRFLSKLYAATTGKRTRTTNTIKLMMNISLTGSCSQARPLVVINGPNESKSITRRIRKLNPPNAKQKVPKRVEWFKDALLALSFFSSILTPS